MPEISTGLIIGGVNILLIYLLIRRVFNDVIAILSALLYFLSLWSGFFTGVYPNSAYLLMIVLLINNFRVSFKVYTFSLFCLIIFVVYPNIGFFPNNPLVNSINAMRGESINAGFSVLSRVIENKYIFYFLRIIEKALVSINPLYYFTNEAAVDGFLVFPPVWFGFIIPFLVGVLSLYKKYKNKIFVSLILVIPSILSSKLIDLNKLFIIAPTIFVAIAFGIYKLYSERDSLFKRVLLFLTLVLFVFQFSMFIITRNLY